jgi:predicted PurR-regulated permease PerM
VGKIRERLQTPFISAVITFAISRIIYDFYIKPYFENVSYIDLILFFLAFFSAILIFLMVSEIKSAFEIFDHREYLNEIDREQVDSIKNELKELLEKRKEAKLRTSDSDRDVALFDRRIRDCREELEKMETRMAQRKQQKS